MYTKLQDVPWNRIDAMVYRHARGMLRFERVTEHDSVSRCGIILANIFAIFGLIALILMSPGIFTGLALAIYYVAQLAGYEIVLPERLLLPEHSSMLWELGHIVGFGISFACLLVMPPYLFLKCVWKSLSESIQNIVAQVVTRTITLVLLVALAYPFWRIYQNGVTDKQVGAFLVMCVASIIIMVVAGIVGRLLEHVAKSNAWQKFGQWLRRQCPERRFELADEEFATR